MVPTEIIKTNRLFTKLHGFDLFNLDFAAKKWRIWSKILRVWINPVHFSGFLIKVLYLFSSVRAYKISRKSIRWLKQLFTKILCFLRKYREICPETQAIIITTFNEFSCLWLINQSKHYPLVLRIVYRITTKMCFY